MTTTGKTSKPNILILMADQLRWDVPGFAGNPVARTPNLDSLAADGVVFSNAFTPNPICVPARASLMTGNYPQVCTGHKTNSGRIREDQPLLTEVLKKEGYRAYASGKLHFVPYSPPGEPRLVHGFERVDFCESGRAVAMFDPEGRISGVEDYFDYLGAVGWRGYSRAHGVGNNDVRPCASPLPREHTVDHWIADCALRQLERHFAESADSPFFLFMSSPKPHSPYDPPTPYDKMYDPREIPPPFGEFGDLRGRNPSITHSAYTHAADTMSPQAWQVARAHYYGCVSWMDRQMGRVLDYLRGIGQFENTLVVFCADHGDLLGDFGGVFKVNHLNGSVRIPFVVSGAGVPGGAVSEAPVGLQDILPTLAAVAGAEIGRSVQGRDLSPVLADPARRVREAYYSSTGEDPAQSVMLADESWKYIYSQAAGGVEELYDQRNDPAELRNLAHDPRYDSTRRDMRRRLMEAARSLEDHGILDGDELRTSDALSGELSEFRMKTRMGWRWY